MKTVRGTYRYAVLQCAFLALLQLMKLCLSNMARNLPSKKLTKSAGEPKGTSMIKNPATKQREKRWKENRKTQVKKNLRIGKKEKRRLMLQKLKIMSRSLKMRKRRVLNGCACSRLGEESIRKPGRTGQAEDMVVDVVVSGSGSHPMEAAQRAVCLDHNYHRPLSAVLSYGDTSVENEEDSLEMLIENCVLDVNFLAGAQDSHDVLFKDVLNDCDVPRDEMFAEIEQSKDPLPPNCPNRLAFVQSEPFRGIFTSAGSTETRLSTCVFARATLASARRTALSTARSAGSSAGASLPWGCGSGASWREFHRAGGGHRPTTSAASPIVGQGRCLDRPKVGSALLELMDLLDRHYPNISLEKLCQPGPCDVTGTVSGKSTGSALQPGPLSQSGVGCRENASATSSAGKGKVLPRSDSTMHSDRPVKEGRAVTAADTDRQASECGISVTFSAPPTSSLLDSPPPSPAKQERSSGSSPAASPGRKRRRERRAEVPGKHVKRSSLLDMTPAPSPDPSSLSPGTPADSEGSAFTHPSPTPSGWLPWDSSSLFSMPPPLIPSGNGPHPLSPSSPPSPVQDSGFLSSEDEDVLRSGSVDRVTLKTDGHGVGAGVAGNRWYCVPSRHARGSLSSNSDDENDAPVTPEDREVRMLLKSDDDADHRCLMKRLNSKAFPQSPFSNFQFNRCV